jgi:hypothetical protein
MPKIEDILSITEEAIKNFNDKIPSIQDGVLNDLLLELKKLDLRGKNIKPSVGNIRLLTKIKARLLNIVLTDDYVNALKEYLKVFNAVTSLSNEVFRQTEVRQSAKNFIKVIKQQTIEDTVNRLTEAGIGANIADRITEILKTNITTGSSYKSLTAQLTEALTTTETPGLLERYAKQVTTDAVNQYSGNVLHTIASDLNYEWYKYQGKDISTTRPFCDAMTDRGYFHVSEIPDLLEANDLYYMKDGQKTKVELNPKTGLPAGMIPGSDASNFFVRRGGYNCGHQVFPTTESRVPEEIKNRVFATEPYKRWKKANS